MDIENVVALIGIALAALLSAIGFYWRNRIEIKKSNRKILYYLLEIRYAIQTSLLDSEHIYQKYMVDMTEIFAARGMPLDTKELERLVGPPIRQYLENINSTIRTNIDESILVPYEDALLEFASTNPILAYQLRGKERIQAFLAHTKGYTQRLNTELLPDLFSEFKLGQQALTDVGLSHHNESIKDLCSILDDDILRVAKSCGIIDYFRCKAVLKRDLLAAATIDVSEVNELVDECFNALLAAVEEHKTDPQSSSSQQ